MPSGRREHVRLADGRTVLIRPVEPSDIDELRRAIKDADPETLRRRFLGGRPPKHEDELVRLVTVDHVRREALAAFAPTGRGVGIARYESLEDDTSAEFAVVVDPGWRHVGLGTALLERLLRAALKNGIQTIHVEFLAANRDVVDLVRRAGGRANPAVHDGIVDENLDVAGGEVSR